MTKETSDKIRAQRLAMPRVTLAEAQAQAKRVMAGRMRHNQQPNQQHESRHNGSPNLPSLLLFV